MMVCEEAVLAPLFVLLTSFSFIHPLISKPVDLVSTTCHSTKPPALARRGELGYTLHGARVARIVGEVMDEDSPSKRQTRIAEKLPRLLKDQDSTSWHVFIAVSE